MSKELLLVVDAVANEKGVPREVIFDAIEAALASAAKKRYPDQDVLARVTIDHKDGTYETYRRWEVVADDVVMESPDRQVRLMDAIDEADGVDVGDYIEEQIENPDFGRIAAQAAKQVIVQRVREAERQQVVDAWKDRVGELITGVVKRAERGNIFVDLGGNAEAFIPKDKGIPRDVLRPGDRVRGYLAEVRSEPRGPQLFISRAAPEFMIELFKLEVPEVGQGLVEIKACARDPGRPRQDRRDCARHPHRSHRRVHRYARFARAGSVQRAQWRARGYRVVERKPGQFRHQCDGAGRSAVDHRR